MIKLDHLSTWYPPAKYVFMPLYKWLRKSAGLKTKKEAFTAVMASSGLLHLVFIGGGAYLLNANWKMVSVFFILSFGLLTVLAWMNPDM